MDRLLHSRWLKSVQWGLAMSNDMTMARFVGNPAQVLVVLIEKRCSVVIVEQQCCSTEIGMALAGVVKGYVCTPQILPGGDTDVFAPDVAADEATATSLSKAEIDLLGLTARQ